MGLLKTLLFKIRKTEDDFWDEDEFWKDDQEQTEKEESQWDWDSLTNERSFLKISDPLQRDKYIRSLVEQVKDASGELDKLSYEYNLVTACLKDMDELEALPQQQKAEVQDYAKRILFFEGEKREFKEKKTRMTDEQFYRMEQFADQMPKAYNDMKEAENYRELIRDDLKRLEGERHAYHYRQGELQHDVANCKGMVLICAAAAILCMLMLFVLQFVFEMETKWGYIVTVFAAAVMLTVLYVKYLDYSQELTKTEKAINRIILLQNTVKIRYVNNAHLLDYLYMKYNTTSAKELKQLWDIYEEECRDRERNEENEKELAFYQEELLKCLRCYQLHDAGMWLHYPIALLDHKEMVEIRHDYINRRQKLRAQIDYNKRLAKDGEKELREFTANYPQYAKEVLTMMERYGA